MSNLDVAMVLRLVDRVTGPAQGVIGTIRNVQAAAGRAGQGLMDRGNAIGAVADRQLASVQGSALGIAAMGGALFAALRPAVNFEAAMDRVAAVSGATGGEVDKLTAVARELGATTAFSASEAAGGMQFLAQAGFSVNETVAAMPGLLDLAAAGQTDLGTTADIASNILSGFSLEAAEMGRVGDVLTNAFTSSNTDLRMLGETMAYVAPNAAAAGIAIETTAAMAGRLGDAGIQGSRAGTALRATISRLAAPTGEAAKALEAMGVETTDAAGNLRPIIEVLAEMDAAMDGMGTGERAGLRRAIFGEEASAAAEILMAQAGTGALADYAATLTKSGTAAGVSEKQMDNMRGSMKRVQSVLEAVAITTGNLLLPALQDMADTLAPMLAGVNDWIARNPELAETIGKVALALVGLKVASVVARLGFAVMLKPLASILMFVGRLVRLVSFANPFRLLASTAVAAAFAIYHRWDGIVGYFRDRFERVEAAFDEHWTRGVVALLREFNPVAILRDAVRGLADFLGDQLAAMAKTIDDTFAGIDLYDDGKRMIVSLWEGLKSRVGEMVADLRARIAGILPDWAARLIGATGPVSGNVPAPSGAPVSAATVRGGGSVTNVGDIHVTSTRADPAAVAGEVKAQLEEQSGRARRPGTGQPLHDASEDAP